MAKAKKTVFFCQNCGHEEAKWLGQCPVCKEWNTFVEEKKLPEKGSESGIRIKAEPISLSRIETKGEERIRTEMEELDRVLGGGIVKGSLVLVGGDPGIGKSTLLLQVCRILGEKGEEIIYISGEESARQIKLRADRMGKFDDRLSLLCETNLETIEEVIRTKKPHIAVIDSIQTMYSEEIGSAPGSVSQVREATNTLMHLAKGMGITIFIVGHVTKEGTVAGPRVLEHMVDTVLYFEGDRHASYRILRSVKNRFGSTNEIGVFEMGDAGLTEVPNPSEMLLAGRPQDTPGTCVTCVMEGARPVLAEIQALAVSSPAGNPRRTSNGFDYNRFAMLLAVLEKRGGLKVSACDAYLNIIGGLSLDEPAADLAAVIALASSYLDRPVPADLVAIGEVGLTGELRSVSQLGQRVSEVRRLGFTQCLIPSRRTGELAAPAGLRLIPVRNIGEAIRAALRPSE